MEEGRWKRKDGIIHERTRKDTKKRVTKRESRAKAQRRKGREAEEF
jgi:hypothetical protein